MFCRTRCLSVQSFWHRPYNNFIIRCRIPNFCCRGNKGQSMRMVNFSDTISLNYPPSKTHCLVQDSPLLVRSFIYLEVNQVTSFYYCLSNAMYSSIGQNIKSFAVRCPMSDVQHTCVCVRALPRSQFLTDFDEIWHGRLEQKSRHDPWKKFPKGGRGHGHVTLNFWGVKCQ